MQKSYVACFNTEAYFDDCGMSSSLGHEKYCDDFEMSMDESRLIRLFGTRLRSHMRFLWQFWRIYWNIFE